jgi:serine/threonine-protein kinase RsbW
VVEVAAPPGDLEFHLAIGSRFENVEIVQIVLNDALERMGVEADTRHWIDLAVREAVANAIKHGNRGDPDKRVEVRMSRVGGEVVVRVEDEGTGFDPRNVVDPLAPENLLRPDGRGIFYIEKFMDGVEWGARPGGGTVVTLRKRVAEAAPQAAGPAGTGEAPRTDPGTEERTR